MLLFFDSSGGLQRLIDGMYHFGSVSGLTISVAKTEVVVFHESGVQGGWSLQGNFLPRSQSFRYLGLVFHEYGEPGPMLRQLPSAGQGATAKLQAIFGKLGCSTTLPMLLRLPSTLVAPAISYCCEVWGSQCQGEFVFDGKKLQGVQLAFLRNVCGRLPVSIPAAAIFAELAKDPCSFKWWVQLVGFALRVSDLPQSLLHREILADNMQDALAKPS